MEPLQISLPADLRAYVDSQTSRGEHASAEAFICALVAREQAQSELESYLAAGLESGEATPLTADDWSSLRARVRDSLGQV